MTDLETGLLIAVLFLLIAWACSMASHKDTKERLNDYRLAAVNLGKFEPKLLEAFGEGRFALDDPEWEFIARDEVIIDVDEVNRLGEVGERRNEQEAVEKDYQQALRILRDDKPIAANPSE